VAEPHPDNVPGPFYVENGCCLACNIPMDVAPGMFEWTADGPHCFVARQPETEAETYRALQALWSAEAGCIRYRGADPDIRRRIVECGQAYLCDGAPLKARSIVRDRVTFRSALAGDDPLALAERLRTFLAVANAEAAASMRESFLDEKWIVEDRVRAELIEEYENRSRYRIRTPRPWNRHVAIFAWDHDMGRPHYKRVAFRGLRGALFEARLGSGFGAAGWGLALLVHDWLAESEKADSIQWGTSQGFDSPSPTPI
jgi:hypothetical protein